MKLKSHMFCRFEYLVQQGVHVDPEVAQALANDLACYGKATHMVVDNRLVRISPREWLALGLFGGF